MLETIDVLAEEVAQDSPDRKRLVGRKGAKAASGTRSRPMDKDEDRLIGIDSLEGGRRGRLQLERLVGRTVAQR